MSDKKKEQQERKAKALKANLSKRKEQQRVRGQEKGK